jgi:GT2 family glycosyltransferase
MPAYNVAPYIGAAVGSVCAQTFADLELIVIDDGSTDGTPEIVAARAAADPRVRLLSQNNRGISHARNRALAVATGDVIAILDGDDLWTTGYLAAQLAIFDARPDVDVVTANAWFLGGPHDGRPARPCPDPRPEPTLAAMLADETAVFIMSAFRRRVIDSVGGFDETLRTNEDYDFWLRAAVAGHRFLRNDRPLGYYRRRGDSLSADEVRMLRGITTVLMKLRPVLADRPAERAILDAQLLRFDTERLAAEATAAIAAGDFPAARRHLSSLRLRKDGGAVRAAAFMSRWTPGLLGLLFRQRHRIRFGRLRTPRLRTEAPGRMANIPS